MCVSLFYVIDTGSIVSSRVAKLGVTYLPSALSRFLAPVDDTVTADDHY